MTGFFSTMRAMLNDKLSMEELVVASGSISVYAGLGVMLGPFLETFVLTAFGARGNFLAVALINVVVSIVMARTAKETLPVSEQKSAPTFLALLTCRCCSNVSRRAAGVCAQADQHHRLQPALVLQDAAYLLRKRAADVRAAPPSAPRSLWPLVNGGRHCV